MFISLGKTLGKSRIHLGAGFRITKKNAAYMWLILAIVYTFIGIWYVLVFCFWLIYLIFYGLYLLCLLIRSIARKSKPGESPAIQNMTFENNKGSVNNMEVKFYQKTWFIVLMLLFVAPVGIFLMWRYKAWNKILKIVLSVVFGFYFLLFLIAALSDTDKPASTAGTTASQVWEAASSSTQTTQEQDDIIQVEQTTSATTTAPNSDNTTTTAQTSSSSTTNGTTSGTIVNTTKQTTTSPKAAVVVPVTTTRPTTRTTTPTTEKRTTTTKQTTKVTTHATTQQTTKSNGGSSGNKKTQEEYDAHQKERYQGGNYILNTNSGLIHDPNCGNAARISDENYKEVNDCSSYLENGYRYAGCCLGR